MMGMRVVPAIPDIYSHSLAGLLRHLLDPKLNSLQPTGIYVSAIQDKKTALKSK